METNSSHETDISDVFNWAKRGKNNFFLGIDSFVKFLRRNIFWLLGLIVIGFILGYVVDKIASKKYESSLIIRANQNSTEYVYNFIEVFNEKLRDTTYLKENGFKKHEIDKIKIEPIVNFNDLLEKYKSKNIALLETLLENASAKDILESEFFRSDYMFHKVTMDLGKTADSGSVKRFISLIDNNPYFKELTTIARAHNDRTLKSYNQILAQIDSTVANYNKQSMQTSNTQGVTFSNDQRNFINDLLVNKKVTLIEMERFKIDSVSLQKPLLLVNDPLLVKKSTILNKMKVLLPVIFVVLFIIIAYFKSSVRKIRSQTLTSAH